VTPRNDIGELVQEHRRVVAWRVDRLRDAGFPPELAGAVARDVRYDVHALLDLTDRGCPAELATRILRPVEDECGPGR
jgi:hypothetical protein